jgi:hypothetical protein
VQREPSPKGVLLFVGGRRWPPIRGPQHLSKNCAALQLEMRFILPVPTRVRSCRVRCH